MKIKIDITIRIVHRTKSIIKEGKRMTIQLLLSIIIVIVIRANSGVKNQYSLSNLQYFEAF